jgi:hypothetical protein
LAATIDQLFALQSVDARLRAMRLELGELERSATEARAEGEAKRQLVEERRQEMAAMERHRRDVEGTLVSEEDKNRERRMRMQRIRNDRELGALKREVDLSKESNALLEDELIRLLEGGEVKATELKALEDELVEIETRLADREREHQERSRTLAEELETRTRERERLAAELDDSVRRRYELVFERKGGVAVVEVRDGGCSGCQMRIPPQLVTQIIRKTEIVSCPNCQRMLFFPSEVRAQP